VGADTNAVPKGQERHGQTIRQPENRSRKTVDG